MCVCSASAGPKEQKIESGITLDPGTEAGMCVCIRSTTLKLTLTLTLTLSLFNQTTEAGMCVCIRSTTEAGMCVYIRSASGHRCRNVCIVLSL
jgi:hypothetical protein